MRVRWHKLGEVENEYTAEKLVFSAIFVPKSFTIGLNLTKFWQKISLHSFLKHGVLLAFVSGQYFPSYQALKGNFWELIKQELSQARWQVPFLSLNNSIKWPQNLENIIHTAHKTLVYMDIRITSLTASAVMSLPSRSTAPSAITMIFNLWPYLRS